MKKHLISTYTLLSVSVFLSLTSCSHWLDVNDNPNTVEDADAKYLFNYAVTHWSGNRTGGDLYIPLAHAIQIQADGDRWAFYGSYYDFLTQMGNTWNDYYVTIGNNLQLALGKLAEEGSQPNAEAQCKILRAIQLYETTMLYGDIPFSEAWGQKNVKYPKFDSQQEVLQGVITLLDETIAQIDPNDENRFDEYDAYFKGDMNKWLAIAHSLRFRTLMTMVDADPSKATEIGQMLQASKMISSAANNMEFKYYDTPGNENPKYSIVQAMTGGINGIFFAHNSVVTPMTAYGDARLSRYFTACTDGKYRGLETQEFYKTDGGEVKDLSMISEYLLRPDCPDLIYSYQEQLLLEAEAYARGLGVPQNLSEADRLYKKGVEAACNYYKADATETAAFINRLPDLSGLSPEKAIYEIHLQQWIDLMDRPQEAFTQWRRSGTKGQEVPALTIPPLNSHPGLMRRWEYPGGELNTNPNAPKTSPNLWDAMWFDL